ncbi:MAG TPA: PP2C family protein-serine/threonine phosphatase [Planctomycetota bacterium]|nr:PP2C family protein-serine/threonine phosphatase [Planctomycetota bacterium]
MNSGGGRSVFADAGTQVVQLDRGRCAILRFTGQCTPLLVEWTLKSLRPFKTPVAINARELSGIDAPFVQALLDHAGRKHPIALVSPPAAMIDLLDQMAAREKIPMFSGEEAIQENGSLPDSLAQERLALQELYSRFKINPLWRKVDQDQTWLCALCGLEVDDVRFWPAKGPEAASLRNVRRHLMADCMAWKAGRQQPLPASVLDQFLTEVNARKASEDAERKKKLSQEIETLQSRVNDMQEIERSVNQAQRRQLHLIPVDPAPDEIADIAVIYRPLQAVSGDFLDFYSLEDNRFGVAIGDVSGHGVETAIVMGMAKMAFRVRSQAIGSLRDLMTYANHDLFLELRRTAFITGVFAIIDRDTYQMTYIRAGHPKPLLKRKKGGCVELEGQGLPFGVDKGPRFSAGLEEQAVDLEPGDILLLYTDGVIEAGPATAQFGVERLIEAFQQAPADGTARVVLKHIADAVDAFVGQGVMGDDVTLICLKLK